jgi:hypothetical protein
MRQLGCNDREYSETDEFAHESRLRNFILSSCVGLEQFDERYCCAYFAAFPIAVLDSQELVTGPLPGRDEETAGWKSGNPKSGDSRISTAPATQGNKAESENQNPSAKLLPMCPL